MVSFFVHGHPVPQGSVRAFTPRGHDRPILTNKSKGLEQWRRLVADAAQPHAHMHVGGVGVRLVFLMPRPKSLPKRRTPAMTKRPDIDRLLRSVLDALTGVMYSDDSQVTEVVMSKRYTEIGGAEGVEVSVWSTDPAAEAIA